VDGWPLESGWRGRPPPLLLLLQPRHCLFTLFHACLPACSPADPFDCPINPSNGLTRERQLTIKLYCDNGGSTTGSEWQQRSAAAACTPTHSRHAHCSSPPALPCAPVLLLQ